MEGIKSVSSFIGWWLIVASSCTYYQNEIFIPPVAEEKTVLEAAYVTTPPNSINAAYWTTADYLKINAQDIDKEMVYTEDGALNVNGMFNGLEDFNNGTSPGLILKAAYDEENIYILASWNDSTLNTSAYNWLYNGPSDPNKDDDPSGWTSQRNSDMLMISFEIGASSNDIWKWDLALSEPMGFAIDLYADGTNLNPDSGEPMFVRNSAGSTFRSGPAYEWDGTEQELLRNPAGSTILDPGFYLINKMDFLGEMVNGDREYKRRCGICHGDDGNGSGSFQNSMVPLNIPGKYNRRTRESLATYLADTSHNGYTYWNRLDETDKVDVLGRMRALAGVPGYALQTPSGSSSDVLAVSNVQVARVDVEKKNNGYKVLFIRKLQSGNEDDIQFNLATSGNYSFDVFLADNDDLNRVGERNKQLVFLSK